MTVEERMNLLGDEVSVFINAGDLSAEEVGVADVLEEGEDMVAARVAWASNEDSRSTSMISGEGGRETAFGLVTAKNEPNRA